MSTERVLRHSLLHRGSEPIEALAHIRAADCQPHPRPTANRSSPVQHLDHPGQRRRPDTRVNNHAATVVEHDLHSTRRGRIRGRQRHALRRARRDNYRGKLNTAVLNQAAIPRRLPPRKELAWMHAVRCATALTLAPGVSVSATSSCFSDRLQRRRRSTVMISARCIVLEVRLALLLGDSLPARRSRCPHRAVTERPAEPDAQEFQFAPGALELVSMDVAADHDRRPLGHPPVALSKRHIVASRRSTSFSIARWHSRASVGCASAFGCTGISTTTRARDPGSPAPRSCAHR
jgi:hypothetical protein